MTKNIFTEIRSEYEFLTRVEKNIADFILKDPKQLINYSMAELSQAAGVSQGSINNFARKFSSGGYSALKLRIAECLFAHDESPFTVIDSSRNIKDAMELKIRENIAAFQNTLELNDESSLKNVVNRILAARKIEIFGVFHSGIAARNLCYQLIQLGIPASFVSDTLMCAVSAAMLDENSLVIAISSLGRTKEIIYAAEVAKKNKVPIVAITSNKSSPLAGIADDVLFTAVSGITISDRRNEVLMSQLLVLDTLCAYIRSMTDNEGQRHFYKLQDILFHDIAD